MTAIVPDLRFSTDHLRSDLTGRTVRGGMVTVAAQMVQFVLSLLSVMVMARLLTPVEYGLVAMVMPITGFVGLFKDLGLSTATVQKDQITHEQVSTLFWINVAVSTGLALLCAAVSPAVGRFYHDTRTTWITLALAGSFVLSGLSAQHGALLRRQMQFGRIAWIDLATAVVSVVTGILTAWLGWSYWSLVAMTLAGSLSNCVAVWVASPWRPGRMHRGAGVREMVRFGGYLTVSQMSNYISGNTDKLIIGRTLGAGALGMYNRAFQLLLMPLDQVYRPLSSVFLTALSRVAGEPERYRRAVRQIGEVLIMAITPLAGISIALAPEVVAVFLGPEWMQVVPLFRTLAIVALALPMNYLGAIILQSSDRTDVMMKWSPVAMAISIASILVGLQWGLIGIATAWAFGALAVRTPVFYYIISRTTRVTFRDMLSPLLSYAIPFTLLAVSGEWLGRVIHLAHPLARLLVEGAILAFVYAAYLCLAGKHRIVTQWVRRGGDGVFQ